MKKILLGLCFVTLVTFVSVNQVSADIGYLVTTFTTLEFEKDKWSRAEPDAAGCIKYTSTANDARVNLYKIGKEKREGNVYKFPRDKKVIVCRETVHLDPSGEEGDGLANMALGFRVFKFNNVNLPADNWDQGTTIPSFIIKYTAKVDNALIKIDDRIMAGPNMSKVFVCDNIIHTDAGIKKVPGQNPNPPNVNYTVDSVLQLLQTHIVNGSTPDETEQKIRLWLIDFITKTPHHELPIIVHNPNATTDQILNEILNTQDGFLDFIRFVHRFTLGRELSQTLTNQWISNGKSLNEIINEIGAAQAAMLNSLRSYYRAYAGREATTSEVNTWLEKIAAGKSEDEIKIEIRFQRIMIQSQTSFQN